MTPSSEAKILDLCQYRGMKADKCIFCDSPENLYFFRRQIVCLECLRHIRKLYAESKRILK